VKHASAIKRHPRLVDPVLTFVNGMVGGRVADRQPAFLIAVAKAGGVLNTG